MSELIKIASWSGKTRGHVIFVHGLDGNAYDTWQANNDKSKFWPEWLANDIEGSTVWKSLYHMLLIEISPEIDDQRLGFGNLKQNFCTTSCAISSAKNNT